MNADRFRPCRPDGSSACSARLRPIGGLNRLRMAIIRAAGVGIGICAIWGCATATPSGESKVDSVKPVQVAPVMVPSNPPPSVPVAELELWMEWACRYNPDLVRLRSEFEVADALAHTAEGWTDPELRLGMGRSDHVADRTWWSANPLAGAGGPRIVSTRSPAATVEQDEQFQVALRFSPPNPLYMSARNAANRALADAARADLRAAEWQVYCALKAALYERDGADQGLALAERLIEARVALLAATTRLVDAGEMTVIDQISARQRVFQARQQRERLIARRTAAVDELRSQVGFVVPPEQKASRMEPASLPEGDSLALTDLQVQAASRRCEIVGAHWRERAAVASLREARSARLPWFSFLEASYGRTTTRDDADGLLRLGSAEPEGVLPRYVSLDHEDEDEWRIELGVTVPVFSLGPQATRVARAGQRAAGTEGNRIAAQVAGEVRAAYEDFLDRKRQIDAARRDIHAQAEMIRTQKQRATETPAHFSAFDEAGLQEAAVDLDLLLNDLDQSGRQAFLRLEAAVGQELAP